MHDLRRELFAHLQRLPIAFFDRNPVGRLVTRVTSDVESLNELFTSGVVAGLGDLFTLARDHRADGVVDWRMAIAAYLVVPGILWVSNVFRVRVREAYREIRTRLAAHQRVPAGAHRGDAGGAALRARAQTRRRGSPRSTATTSTPTSSRSRSTRCTSRRSRS
jgi:ABC-type multidrug transport system fused ATPase/permease subunit